MMSKENLVENKMLSQYQQFQKNITENVSQNKYYSENPQNYLAFSETGKSSLKTQEIQESFKQDYNAVCKWAPQGEIQAKIKGKQISSKNKLEQTYRGKVLSTKSLLSPAASYIFLKSLEESKHNDKNGKKFQ